MPIPGIVGTMLRLNWSSVQKALITWPNGNPRQSYHLSVLEGGEGLVREYFRNGRLRALGKVQKRLQNGLWKYFHDNGKRSALGNFREGMLRGEWIYYDEDREYRVIHWQVVNCEGFNMSLPQGWVGLVRQGHLLHSLENRGDPQSAWISVSLHHMEMDLSIRDFTLQLLTRSEKSLKSMRFKIQEMEPQLIRNLESCLALTTVVHQKHSLCTRMAFIKDGTNLYKIQAVCPTQKYRSYKTLFDECLNSFLLKSSTTQVSGLHLIYPPDLEQE